MATSDAGDWQLIETLYRHFNARDVDAVLSRMADDVEWPNGWEGGYVCGHNEVRDYWMRQWAEIDPIVTPVDLVRGPDGQMDVTVHQVVRDRHGAVLSEVTVHHVYRFDGGQITHMEIRE
jgi:ketosteroid isomerase-like protein